MVFYKKDIISIFYKLDFQSYLVILCAAVIKVDKKASRYEFEYIRKEMQKVFKTKLTHHHFALIKEFFYKKIPLSRICVRVSAKTNYAVKLQIIHFLYGLALSDTIFLVSEYNVINFIGRLLDISNKDMQSVHAHYFNPDLSGKKSNHYYDILGVSESVNYEELNKSYRDMAKKHHPDKVSHLGKEFQEAAKIQFQKISDAYQNIKKIKGYCNQ